MHSCCSHVASPCSFIGMCCSPSSVPLQFSSERALALSSNKNPYALNELLLPKDEHSLDLAVSGTSPNHRMQAGRSTNVHLPSSRGRPIIGQDRVHFIVADNLSSSFVEIIRASGSHCRWCGCNHFYWRAVGGSMVNLV